MPIWCVRYKRVYILCVYYTLYTVVIYIYILPSGYTVHTLSSIQRVLLIHLSWFLLFKQVSNDNAILIWNFKKALMQLNAYVFWSCFLFLFSFLAIYFIAYITFLMIWSFSGILVPYRYVSILSYIIMRFWIMTSSLGGEYQWKWRTAKVESFSFQSGFYKRFRKISKVVTNLGPFFSKIFCLIYDLIYLRSFIKHWIIIWRIAFTEKDKMA